MWTFVKTSKTRICLCKERTIRLLYDDKHDLELCLIMLVQNIGITGSDILEITKSTTGYGNPNYDHLCFPKIQFVFKTVFVNKRCFVEANSLRHHRGWRILLVKYTALYLIIMFLCSLSMVSHTVNKILSKYSIPSEYWRIQ